ncbi:stage II sporulation protein P [Bacillus salitolerans]|uniref:Stage II sporulation protein P n=1 Tax=Bacillus salitolerans TaxID=1437434 RepID=A0ABW4LRA2_9BACI
MNNSKKTSYRGNSFIYLIVLTITIIVTFFVLASIISSIKNDIFVGKQINQNVKAAPLELLVSSMGVQNAYFSQNFSKDEGILSFERILLKSVLQINFWETKSLFGAEIPGLSLYNTKILIPGVGTDNSNLPFESSPPVEDLLLEREIAQKELEKLNEFQKSNKPKKPLVNNLENKRVLIYHSHSYESFLPLLGLTNDPDRNKAVDAKTNITLVGEMLAQELEEQGIGSIVDKTNIGHELNKKGWKTAKAYEVSRSIVQTTISNNKDIEYLIDIHRDSARKKTTTAVINNKPYARVYFVVGMASKNYEKSFTLAKEIHSKLELDYPGISRGIFEKGLDDGNGHYNQDLSQNSILIEIGGVDNNMEEIKNTVDALAKVLGNYILSIENGLE